MVLSSKSFTTLEKCWLTSELSLPLWTITDKRKKADALWACQPCHTWCLCSPTSLCFYQETWEDTDVWAHSTWRRYSNTTLSSSVLALISQAPDIPAFRSLHAYWTLWWWKRWSQIKRQQGENVGDHDDCGGLSIYKWVTMVYFAVKHVNLYRETSSKSSLYMCYSFLSYIALKFRRITRETCVCSAGCKLSSFTIQISHTGLSDVR